MLRKILAEIIEEGAVKYKDIAKDLAISEGMVKQMVWELQRLGYLDQTMQGCSESMCAGCPMKCGTKSPLQHAFVLTSKGKNFLERNMNGSSPEREQLQAKTP